MLEAQSSLRPPLIASSIPLPSPDAFVQQIESQVMETVGVFFGLAVSCVCAARFLRSLVQ